MATMVAAFVALLDITIVNICLPQIQKTYSADVDQLGWVTTAYMMANVIVMPLTGWGRARFGYRRYFAVSCLIFAIGSALCASVDSWTAFVLARALQGLGGGALIPLSQAILLDRFPKRQVDLAGALFGVAALAGPMIGPSVGGHLLEYISWPWLFRASVPAALFSAFLVFTVLEEPAPTSRRPFDLYGFALLAVGLGTLQFVLEEGNRRGWLESDLVASLLLVSAICLPAVVVHSVKSRGLAAIDVSVFKNLRFTAASLLHATLGVAMISGSFFNALFFSTVLDFTPIAIGSVLFWANIIDFVAIPLGAALVKWIDARWVLGIGLLLLLWSFLLNGALRLDAGFGQLVFPAAVRSFGSSLVMVPLTITAFVEIDRERRPGAVGLFNVLRELGASIGTAAAAHLLTSRGDYHTSVLVESLEPRDLESMRAASVPGSMAALRQLVAIDSFSDVYLMFALLVLVTLPCILALKSKAEPAPV